MYRPCPACAAQVDTLRAELTLAFEDGLEFPCSSRCAELVRAGTRSRRILPGTDEDEPAETQPSARVRVAPLPPQRPLSSIDAPDAPTFPVTGLAIAFVGLLTAIAPGPSWLVFFSAGASALAAGMAVRASVPYWKGVGMFPWLAVPAGSVLSALASLFALYTGERERLSLAGAAVGAAVALVRISLDASARIPVIEVANRLLEALPRRVRIPLDQAEAGGPFEYQVVTDRVRAGEEVLAREGDQVGVDGIVKAGEATVLPYLAARVGVVRRQGDPVLAGARVLSGALRILATRVGDERALAKPQRFGAATSAVPARLSRFADQAARWGAFATAALAIGGLAIGSRGGPTGPLAAAAAVLLVSPLLSIRRAAEAPFVAAAAAAAERGIVFPSPRALENAGRVQVAALCSHGTVTEGMPEVVDVLALDGADARALVALAAAAQTAAEQSAISAAIRNYAVLHTIPPESVRRAVYVEGRGVTALSPGGEPLVIGNRQLLLDEGVSVAVADAEATRIEQRGQTALFIALGGRVRALLALQDPVRAGARAAVQRIFDLQIEPVLLSGDHRGTAEAIARTLDVDHVKAELLPDERGQEVRRQRDAGSVVACCGVATHDEAALAAADVPIVLGAAGSFTAESVVALASDDVRDAATSLFIAKSARAESLRALVTSLSIGTVMTAGSALGFVPPLLAAIVGLALEAFALPAGERLLRRVDLRAPTRGDRR